MRTLLDSLTLFLSSPLWLFTNEIYGGFFFCSSTYTHKKKKKNSSYTQKKRTPPSEFSLKSNEIISLFCEGGKKFREQKKKKKMLSSCAMNIFPWANLWHQWNERINMFMLSEFVYSHFSRSLCGFSFVGIERNRVREKAWGCGNVGE